jgi:hypothetical protein
VQATAQEYLLHLQRSAGNQAALAYVQRGSPRTLPVQRAADKKTAAAMNALEEKLSGYGVAAQDNVATLTTVSDAALRDLAAANTHLQASSQRYKAGHKLFTDVLHRADSAYEVDKAIEDSVQGIMVAAALAIVAPEALLTTKLLQSAAASTSARISAIGLKAAASREAAVSVVGGIEGGAGEVVEIGAGAAVGATINDPGKPSDTATGAGPSPGDQFETALVQLGAMIGAIPRVGKLVSAQSQLSWAAQELAREAARLRHGEQARWSAAELETKAAALQVELGRASAHMVTAKGMAARLAVLKGQVLAKPLQDSVAIENNLWLTWMASLEGPAHEVLDNSVLLQYLGPEGKKLIGDTGWWTFDAETREAAADARLTWLRTNGITPGTYPDTQYRTEMKLREVRRDLTGKPGEIVQGGQVRVGGRVLRYAGNAGRLAAGTPVTALHFMAPDTYTNGSASIAKVYDNDVIAYCNVDRTRLRAKIPHVVGLPEAQALERIRQAQLIPVVSYRDQAGVGSGHALGISPAPETDLAADSEVTLVVSR